MPTGSDAFSLQELVAAISRTAAPSEVQVIALSVDEGSSKETSSSAVMTARGAYAATKAFLGQVQAESTRIEIRDVSFRRVEGGKVECRATFVVFQGQRRWTPGKW